MVFQKILFVVFTLFSLISAQISFPLGSEVVDVTKEPYFAKGDGKADDTEAIQRALDDHPNGDFIIYLPHGTYKISKQLSWPKSEEPTEAYRRTILQGESMGGTILILKDNARGFDNPEIPRAMIYTGIGPHPRHRNAVRDMSLRTGKGNPGAIGIRFNAASQGTVFNVKIFSGDKNGAGVAGIDMGFAENVGPLLLKNIEVRGFDIGIYTRTPFFGMTLEHISLSGQRKYGI
ncbi:MAG TPA: glycosyl hydrolase family 28-related protein, partial [Fibrobacteraceae bacterium]|nr:glycosyl hydrolase family 28-related protein [Fibrobacteraceae bacterium]